MPLLSVSMSSDEIFWDYSRLLDGTLQCPNGNFLVHWHDTPSVLFAQNDMAAFLPDNVESHLLENLDDLGARKMWKFRHERESQMS